MVYLDSSLLFSVHGRDANTASAALLLQSTRAVLLVTPLCEVEVVNALHLRVYRREITPQQAQQSMNDLEKNIGSGVYKLLPIPESAFARAKALAQSLTPTIGVRAADLLHVAAALELGATSLYTFDRKQHQAAKAAGLGVNRL
jgi:predicted nucleic acid-binding protein